MGQINPTVKLYVIALDGGAQTVQLGPPHSFEERYFKTFPGEREGSGGLTFTHLIHTHYVSVALH